MIVSEYLWWDFGGIFRSKNITAILPYFGSYLQNRYVKWGLVVFSGIFLRISTIITCFSKKPY